MQSNTGPDQEFKAATSVLHHPKPLKRSNDGRWRFFRRISHKTVASRGSRSVHPNVRFAARRRVAFMLAKPFRADAIFLRTGRWRLRQCCPALPIQRTGCREGLGSRPCISRAFCANSSSRIRGHRTCFSTDYLGWNSFRLDRSLLSVPSLRR